MQRTRSPQHHGIKNFWLSRRLALTRTGAAVICAGTILAILWAAGVDPWSWWLEHQRTLREAAHKPERVTPPGLVSAVQPQPVGTDSSVSQSAMPLVLKAIHRGRNTRDGTVELGVNALSPQTYQAGAVLANGARIEEIYPDYVVLTRDGKRVRLYEQSQQPVDGRSTSDPSLFMVGGTPQMAAAVPTSHDSLTDYLRVSPVYDGDTVVGLEVYANDRSDAFGRLGLEPGDRIKAIDGEPITDSDAAIANLRRLTEGAALQVTVERGGQLKELALDGLILISANTKTSG